MNFLYTEIKVKVFKKYIYNVVEHIDKYGNSPLILACRNGNFGLVEKLTKIKYVNLKRKNKLNDTGLILAYKYKHIEIIQLLLKTLYNIKKTYMEIRSIIYINNLQNYLNKRC
jgi:ankyrin repeat protein